MHGRSLVRIAAITLLSLGVDAHAAGGNERAAARTIHHRTRLVAKMPRAWRGLATTLQQVSKPATPSGAPHESKVLATVTDRRALANLAISLSGLDAAARSNWLSRDARALQGKHNALSKLVGLRDEAKELAHELRATIMAADQVQVEFDPSALRGRQQQVAIRLLNAKGASRELFIGLGPDGESGHGWVRRMWEPSITSGARHMFEAAWMRSLQSTSFTLVRDGVERYEDRDSKVYRNEIGDAAGRPPIRGWVQLSDGTFRANVKVDAAHQLQVVADGL